jgi:hypothetical protein
LERERLGPTRVTQTIYPRMMHVWALLSMA